MARRSARRRDRGLDEVPAPVRVRLAAAWTSLLFLYVYVDILGLYFPGVVEDILAGVVWEFAITQGWALGALTLMAVPILLVLASVTLPARAARMTNLVAGSLYVVVSLGNAVGEAWVGFFALAVGLEVLVLAVILRTAWTWPRQAPRTRTSPDGSADHQFA